MMKKFFIKIVLVIGMILVAGEAGVSICLAQVLVVPTGTVLEIDSDRPYLIRVEGTLRSYSPSGPVYLSQGGVEVASGGTFNMQSGQLNVSDTDLAVFGGDLSNVKDLRLGYLNGSVANFTQTSGNTSVYDNLYVAYGTDSQASFTMDGGSLSVGNCLYLSGGNSNRSQSRFDMNGGNVSVGNYLDIGSRTPSVFSQSGGTVVTENGRVHGDSLYELTGGTLQVDGQFLLYDQAVLDFGGGDATVGQVTALELAIDGGQVIGEGTIIANLVSNHGTISPGSAAGTLTVHGEYIQSLGGKLLIELGGLVPDEEYDILAIDGVATLGGTLETAFLGDFSPEIGDYFDIVTATSFVGDFDTTVFSTGFEFDLSFVDSGTTLRLTTTAVPEPATLTLLVIGGLVMMRRKRK